VPWKDILKMADTMVSIRVISFTGKKEDWPIWSVKFLARARRKGYRDVLLGKSLPRQTLMNLQLRQPKQRRMRIAKRVN
jgi:hypothetical protein